MTLALDLGIDLVSGLFGGGPDKEKVADRTARVRSSAAMAQQGDINAWHVLGAIATPAVPLPIPINPPYSSKSLPLGWTAHEWGDAYDPIREAARKYYDQYAPQFTVSSAGSPGTPGQGSPLSTTATLPSAAQAGLGTVALILVVLVVGGLLWKSLK